MVGNPIYTQRAPEAGVAGPLAELALDLRCSWNHAADELWTRLEPELWELTHNPWVVLQTTSPAKLQSALADPEFRARLERVLQGKREVEDGSAWFQQQHAGAPLTVAAYFSMEFMLSEALPIYSGGLGNVAGDQLKAASDLGVPVAAVGLLYQQGYFRQMIDAHGSQHALYPFNDPGQLPIAPLRDEHGEWLRLPVILPGFKLWIRAWQAQVGRRMLYLLDANDPANLPEYRGITSELYGGGPELRLVQELVLGIGGWRLLRALGMQPEVCHLNEGHAAFAVLERAHAHMQDSGQPFAVALEITRAGNLFTTHTPVEAGFDRFAPELMEKYLKFYAEERLRISMDDLLALGRRNPGDRARAVQHGLPGPARQWRGEWREPPPRRSEPADLSTPVPALAAAGSAGRACHQRRPHADLGLRLRRRSLDRGLRQGAVERYLAGVWRIPCGRCPTSAFGKCAAKRAASWWSTRGNAWPANWQPRARRLTNWPPRRMPSTLIH